MNKEDVVKKNVEHNDEKTVYATRSECDKASS